MSSAVSACSGIWDIARLFIKQVCFTLAKAMAVANLHRTEAGEKPITMNSLAVQAGLAATTITRLARTDDKAASALSLGLAWRIATVLDCGTEDLVLMRVRTSSFSSRRSSSIARLFWVILLTRSS